MLGLGLDVQRLVKKCLFSKRLLNVYQRHSAQTAACPGAVSEGRQESQSGSRALRTPAPGQGTVAPLLTLAAVCFVHMWKGGKALRAGLDDLRPHCQVGIDIDTEITHAADSDSKSQPTAGGSEGS